MREILAEAARAAPPEGGILRSGSATWTSGATTSGRAKKSTAMTAGERLFCDTNVLVSAVDRRRKLHAQALHVLNALPNRGVTLCVSGQIVG